MTIRWITIVLMLLLAAVIGDGAAAETIVLHSGEKFTSQSVWEEGRKIRFNMQGLLVSVNKSEVAAILKDDGSPKFLGLDNPAGLPAPGSAPMKNSGAPETSSADPAQNRAPAKDKTPLTTPAKPASDTAPRQAPAVTGGTGLKGLDWQMQPETIPGLIYDKTEPEFGGIDYYYRPDEPMQLDHARLDGVRYGFWRKRLYAIMFWVQGPPGYRDLKKVIFSHYGSGTRSSSGLERYIWRSRDTDRMLEFDKDLNTGIFWMRSRLLDQRIKELYPQE